MNIKVVTWNIAGGIKYKEAEENPKYISDTIKAIRPDVLCLQETHINEERSLVQELFKNQYDHIHEFGISPSHNDKRYKLGLATLSNLPIKSCNVLKLPNPSYTKVLKNGSKIHSHDKALLVANFGNFVIGNTQFLPLHVFDKSYESELNFVNSIDIMLNNNLEVPLILCGDFNHVTPHDLYTNSFQNLRLKDSLDGSPTFVYRDENPDHIYYSSEFEVKTSKVINTETDHYLCYSELTLT